MSDLKIIQQPLCTNCGSCCSYMRTPPFIAIDGMDESYDVLPPRLKREVYLSAMTPLAVRPDDAPCIWLNPVTKQCRHYNQRPDICREFEAGGKDCLRVRGERLFEVESDA